MQTKLNDVYDVHYQNPLTEGKWHRWMNAPRKDIQECYEWIREYGKPANICGFVHIPGNKFKTEFRIVRCERTIIETLTA